VPGRARKPSDRARGLQLLSALHARGVGVLDELDEVEAARFAKRFYEGWVAGRIPPAVVGVSDPVEANRLLGAIWRGLPSRLTERMSIERRIRGDIDARRWCWVPGWYAMSQDEDLLLMRDALMRPLLEEAAAGCTKREYVLSIVEHHARDSAHHALWDGAHDLEPRLRRIGGWATLARNARALALATYLERLGSYAEARDIDEAEVQQRVYDLRRCSADASRTPAIHREGRRWVARLDRANVLEGWLVVDSTTGRMRGSAER
jgi:hypothetical protein